jgi:hypothetical protein
MKCQKCNHVSFDYLDSCAKCGADLGAQKSELNINLPGYRSLGILEYLQKKGAPESEDETSVAQGEDYEKQSGDVNLSDFGGPGSEAAIAAESFAISGGDLNIGDVETVFDEPAQKSAAASKDSGIDFLDVDIDNAAEPTKKEAKAEGEIDIEGIDLDLGDLNEAPEKKKDNVDKKKEEGAGLDIDLDDLKLG